MPLPSAIDTGFIVEEPALWALDIPVENIPLSQLDNNLDIPYLDKEGTNDWNLSPRELIEHFDREISHAEKVNKADLQYPIEIYNHHWNWIILDGVHRYTKAIRLGHDTISARKVSLELALQCKISEEAYRKWKGQPV